MYYLRARYYDPATGRFISRDPVKGTLTNPITQNAYVYAGNNPINITDPSGEWWGPFSIDSIHNDWNNCQYGTAIAKTAVVAGGTGLAAVGVVAAGAYVAGAVGIEATIGITATAAKTIASKQQIGQEGKIIAGPGSNAIFRNAKYIVQDYGGEVVDWVKKTSTSFKAPDGTSFQTHWVENLKTGERVLYKTKLGN